MSEPEDRRRPLNQIAIEDGLRMRAMVWERSKRGVWTSRLLRELPISKRQVWDPLTYVEVDMLEQDLCFRCLSPYVEPMVQEQMLWMHCDECGFDYRVLEEDDDPELLRT